MIWTNTKRTLKSGFVSFWRNGSVSLASVLVMIVTLLVISSIIFIGAMLNSTLKSIESKVDINVYITQTASDTDISALQKSIKNLPEVASATLTTREEALTQFRQRHQDDELTLQALDEIGTNPLGASFNIRAKDPSQYESIVKFLDSQKTGADGNGAGIIERVNYSNNKAAIDALNRIMTSSRKLGTLVVVFFALVSILITFNTIRLAIYIFREEIAVMRLVGASEMYIRGPFVTVGLMYGAVAGIITLILLYPMAYYVGPLTFNLGTGLNVFNYYISNFGQMFLVVIGTGLILGAVSSYLAVKKYLKV
ncbi:MAG: permease-like cell division protein FtsX [bacterium]